MDAEAGEPGAPERWWAVGDLVVGAGLLALGGLCVAGAVAGYASHLTGHVVHPDAVLVPLSLGIMLAGVGTLFLLAASAMRRRAAGRWTAHWSALLAPLALAAFVWLSLR